MFQTIKQSLAYNFKNERTLNRSIIDLKSQFREKQSMNL